MLIYLSVLIITGWICWKCTDSMHYTYSQLFLYYWDFFKCDRTAANKSEAQVARRDLMGRSKHQLMSPTTLGQWTAHAVVKNTPKTWTGNETSTLSLTLNPHSHRNTYISMATDKRVAGLQKEAIDKEYTQTWMESNKLIYGEKKKSWNEVRDRSRTTKVVITQEHQDKWNSHVKEPE